MTREEAMDNYYDPEERSQQGEIAQAGWRRRIGQLLRFEVALAPWDWERIDDLLDLGCGPASLVDYLEKTGREVDYTGVERRSRAVEFARAAHPDQTILQGDLYDQELVDGSYDLVVAIGAQVDGRPVEDQQERLARIRRLVERCERLARRAAAIILLDEEALRARPVFGLEPALYGMTGEELDDLGDDLARPTARYDFLSTDQALYLHDGEVFRGVAEAGDRWAAHRRVVDYALREGADQTDVAWLWLESRRYEAARDLLDELADERGGEAQVRHLCDRLEREAPEG